MSEQAVQSLDVALRQRVKHFGDLEGDQIAQAAVDLIEESEATFERCETIPAVLARVAALGSVDAVALMVVMGCTQEQVACALRDLAMRSEDIKDGLLVAALTAEVEEFAEGEIAAGRMTKARCPKTGAWLYSSVDKKNEGRA